MPARPLTRLGLIAILTGCTSLAMATDPVTELDLKASCSTSTGSAADKIIYSDEFRLKIRQQQVLEFTWESLRLRATLGHECSIDLDDGVQLEAIERGWRLSLKDPAQARRKRGYDTERGNRCSVRIRQNGDEWQLQPSCPVLCGSRENFTELAINPKTGQCRYELNQAD